MEYCTVAADGENIVINILGETTSAYRTNIGGIVGLVNEGAAVDNCTNNGYISSKMQRNDDAARWEYIGGVVGVNQRNCIQFGKYGKYRDAFGCEIHVCRRCSGLRRA